LKAWVDGRLYEDFIIGENVFRAHGAQAASTSFGRPLNAFFPIPLNFLSVNPYSHPYKVHP